MLKSLSLSKFRAFSQVSLDFTKLNIFVGPNNSGKSSVISAINLIAQNLRNGSQEYSLALNGPYAQLGTFYDAVHGHSPRSKMGISFKFGNFTYSYVYKYRIQRKEIELHQAIITDGDFSYQYKKDADDTSGHSHYIESKSLRLKHVLRTRPRFHGFYTYLPLSGLMPISNSTARSSNESMIKLRNFAFRSMRHLEEHFRAFDSVGAFRAAPERTYHYTGEAPTKVGRFGENFAQMLASSSSSRSRSEGNLIREVSEWFRESGVAKSVKINALTKRHFELQIEDSTGSSSNITDSGFGCSQVMPVLVGGLKLIDEAHNPMYVVQEPEIHLHPSAAAHLGSYFVSLANQGVQCFVETHSENIILRVARNIAEGAIKSSDVRIYWVSGTSGEHDVTAVNINSDGTFSDAWPEGFFPTRATETMLLAKSATKARRPSGHN